MITRKLNGDMVTGEHSGADSLMTLCIQTVQRRNLHSDSCRLVSSSDQQPVSPGLICRLISSRWQTWNSSEFKKRFLQFYRTFLLSGQNRAEETTKNLRGEMNIFKRFHIYCYFAELITSGTGVWFLLSPSAFWKTSDVVFFISSYTLLLSVSAPPSFVSALQEFINFLLFVIISLSTFVALIRDLQLCLQHWSDITLLCSHIICTLKACTQRDQEGTGLNPRAEAHLRCCECRSVQAQTC